MARSSVVGRPQISVISSHDFQTRFTSTGDCSDAATTTWSGLMPAASGRDRRPVSAMSWAIHRFVDQSWMGFAPAYLESVAVVRDPIFNIAYWNLPHRFPEQRDGYWQIGGERVGFFHFSGLDLGKLDQDRYLYILGRADDMVITGGLNVYPSEVENVLLAHPKVVEAAVVGIPDSERGEVLKAAVVPMFSK